MCNIQLLHGDCFRLMKNIPDNSIDLILTDPPYNVASRGNIKINGRKEINNDIAKWDKEDFKPELLIEDFKRILKPDGNIFIFINYNQLGKYHTVFDKAFDTFQFMVWHKTNPVPQIRKTSFLSSCELIICCWNKGHKWNFKKQTEMHNFFESPICMGKERTKHPTQKPLSILKHIIEIASNENDVVLDPFFGSGSTAVACNQTNRNFVGMEKEEENVIIAQDRINTEIQNQKMQTASLF